MSKKPLKVPDYFKDLPDDALLNAREVADIFGYKLPVCKKHQIDPGHIPMYDDKKVLHMNGHVVSRLYWKVKTIREWIENVNRNIPK